MAKHCAPAYKTIHNVDCAPKAYIFYEAKVADACYHWFDLPSDNGHSNLDMETGDMSDMKKDGIVKTIRDLLMALKNLNYPQKRARDHVSDKTIRNMIRVCWFCFYARNTDNPPENPLFVSQSFVDNKVMKLFTNRNHFGMVSLGFDAIGRMIDKSKQQCDPETHNLMAHDGERQVLMFQVFNPMTSVPNLQEKSNCALTLKANNEFAGYKRSASELAHVATMSHREECIRELMVKDHRNVACGGTPKKKGQPPTRGKSHHILLRMCMCQLGAVIQMHNPFRCIEVCSWSWIDIEETIEILNPETNKYEFVQIPLLIRCMFPADVELPPAKMITINSYKGKTKKEHSRIVNHVFPDGLSLIDVSRVFQFVARIILDIAPEILLCPIANPMCLMIFQIPVTIADLTKAAFLSTSTFGEWMNKNRWSLPDGADPKRWLMPYTSRVTIARLIKKLQLVDDTVANQKVRAWFLAWFAHAKGSQTICKVYAIQCDMVCARVKTVS